MSHEVWIARDGDGRLFQYHQEPEYDDVLHSYGVPAGEFWECIRQASFPFIKPNECIKFVAAERFVNGEPVSEGETIPVRIAVVANEKREYVASGWSLGSETHTDARLCEFAAESLDGDNLSRTIITARVPVPKVIEVQGVVKGTVTP